MNETELRLIRLRLEGFERRIRALEPHCPDDRCERNGGPHPPHVVEPKKEPIGWSFVDIAAVLGKRDGESLIEAAKRVARVVDAVANAGFREQGDAYGDVPTLWCKECGRDSGFHNTECSKMRSFLDQAINGMQAWNDRERAMVRVEALEDQLANELREIADEIQARFPGAAPMAGRLRQRAALIDVRSESPR